MAKVADLMNAKRATIYGCSSFFVEGNQDIPASYLLILLCNGPPVEICCCLFVYNTKMTCPKNSTHPQPQAKVQVPH